MTTTQPTTIKIGRQNLNVGQQFTMVGGGRVTLTKITYEPHARADDFPEGHPMRRPVAVLHIDAPWLPTDSVRRLSVWDVGTIHRTAKAA